MATAAGILLLALLCALFVPVRYCIAADGKLGREGPVHVEIKVTWLLHIVNAAFSYSKTARLRVRVFWFTLLDTSSKKGGEREGKAKKAEKAAEANLSEKKGTEPDGKEKEIQKVGKEPLGTRDKGMEEKKKEEKPQLIHAKENGIQGKEQENKDGEDEHPGRIRRVLKAILAFFEKICKAVKNIEYTIEEIYGKIKNVMENIRYYTNIIKGEVFQSVFRNAKKQLFWVCRMLKPAKCRLDLKAGTGDPSSTGQLMAVYGMLYPFIGNHVSIQTDFENKVAEGNLLIKGKVVSVIFLIAAIRMLLDKNIWKLLKLLKKEDA